MKILEGPVVVGHLWELEAVLLTSDLKIDMPLLPFSNVSWAI